MTNNQFEKKSDQKKSSVTKKVQYLVQRKRQDPPSKYEVYQLKIIKTTRVCIIAGENYTLENKNTVQQLNTGHQLGHLPQYLDTEMFFPSPWWLHWIGVGLLF